MIPSNDNVIEYRKWILNNPHMKSISEVEELLKNAKEKFESCKEEHKKLNNSGSATRSFLAGCNLRTWEMLLDKKKILLKEEQKINYDLSKNGQIGFLL